MLLTSTTESARTHAWKATERHRMEFYKWGEGIAAKALAKQWQPVPEAINQANSVQEIEQLAHQVINMNPIRDMLYTIYPPVGLSFAIRSYMNMISGKSGGSSTLHTKQETEVYQDRWTAFLQSYALTNAGVRIQKITQTTLDFVSRVIAKALGEGWSIQRTVAHLQSGWQSLSRTRAITIARTEIISASNLGSITGVRQTSIPVEKMWIATRDGRTRDTHASADGQRVALNGKFIVGGHEMDYPGDANAPAEETIFCRCAIGYVPL